MGSTYRPCFHRIFLRLMAASPPGSEGPGHSAPLPCDVLDNPNALNKFAPCVCASPLFTHFPIFGVYIVPTTRISQVLFSLCVKYFDNVTIIFEGCSIRHSFEPSSMSECVCTFCQLSLPVHVAFVQPVGSKKSEKITVKKRPKRGPNA